MILYFQISILNIKCSFKIADGLKLDADSTDYLYYSAGSVDILKITTFTFSIMGKNRRFGNMTGVPNFKNINHGLSLFKSTCNIIKNFDFKINSISFKVRLIVSQDKFSDFFKKKPALFNVKCFPKFSGVCFKHEKIRVSGN